MMEGLLSSIALLDPAGRCLNYTIWQQKTSFSIDTHSKLAQILPKFKSEIFHYHITADVLPVPNWFRKDLKSEKKAYTFSVCCLSSHSSG